MKKPERYEQYIKSAQWRRISKLMRQQAGYKCAKCGLGSATLEVHHLTYERFGHERMADLVVLCKVCHEAAVKHRVLERVSRGQVKSFENGYDTYMTKKHGEDYYLHDSDCDREAFADWLLDQEGAEPNYDPFG